MQPGGLAPRLTRVVAVALRLLLLLWLLLVVVLLRRHRPLLVLRVVHAVVGLCARGGGAVLRTWRIVRVVGLHFGGGAAVAAASTVLRTWARGTP